jgi:iron(III) transport system substrate-binding protein
MNLRKDICLHLMLIRKAFFFLPLLLGMGMLLSACSRGFAQPLDQNPEDGLFGRLVIYSGRSEPLIQPVIAAFQEVYPEVQILLKSGRNSEIANALLEERNNPQADVFVSTELFTIQALAAEGLFQGYQPEAAAFLPVEAIGPEASWVGLTQRVRVIMYNRELLTEDEVPTSIFELADPQWKGKIAAAGSTNGSMQAQVAAMLDLIGEEATAAWLSALQENEAVFFGGHTDVRKAVGAGEFELGLVNHYYYHLEREEGKPVGIIYPDQAEGQIGLLTNMAAAGILNGSRNLPAAHAFIDFLLSPEGQRLFAEVNYEYPLVPGADLHPDVEPLINFRLADVNPAQAAQNLDQTFDLFERLRIP